MIRQLIILVMLLLFTGILPTLAQQPNPPENLTAVQAGNDTLIFVDLDWQSGNYPYFELYKIYRKNGAISDSGHFHLVGVTHRTDFKDRFVHPNRTYSYHVLAFRMGRESLPSNDAEVTITGAGGLADGQVKGSVINESTNIPIVNADVVLISTTTYQAYRVRTNLIGSYTASVYPGDYLIAFNKPLYYGEFYDNVLNPMNATIVNVTENGVVTGIDAALTPREAPIFHTISGRVTNTNGDGVAARIFVFKKRWFGHFPRPVRTVTDGSGNYFVNAAEGDTVVVFAKPFNRDYLPEFYNDKQTFADADRIAISGDVNNIDFVLEDAPVYPNSVEGTVASVAGEPVFAQIIAFRMNYNNPYRPFKNCVFTDSLGNYELENLRPGKYYLFARPEIGCIPSFFRYDGVPTLSWYLADSLMIDSTTAVMGADFNLLTVPDSGYASINGMVQSSDGSGVSEATVYAVNDNDEIVSYAVTNSNGEYIMEGVVPGTYTLVAGDVGYQTDETTGVNVDYSLNVSNNVNFTLTPDNTTSVEGDDITITDYELSQNYPNPFNPSTTIRFSIPEDAQVKLIVYDITGSEAATLVDGFKTAGTYNVNFDAASLTSGVYFYRLESAGFTAMKKMILMK